MYLVESLLYLQVVKRLQKVEYELIPVFLNYASKESETSDYLGLLFRFLLSNNKEWYVSLIFRTIWSPARWTERINSL